MSRAHPGLREAPPPKWTGDFAAVYARHFHDVERWLRALGVPTSEREDVTQEVFVVVERKLSAFDGANLPGWLFRIASRVSSDWRRRAWFKNLFSKRRAADLDGFEWSGLGPAEALERREEQRRLAEILRRMSEKRRTAFVLFEIEGYTGEEIAALLEIPVATVWTRLHHARREFRASVEVLLREESR
jgi:RNA polymerase sigma-70 factor (ECF subfamily)